MMDGYHATVLILPSVSPKAKIIRMPMHCFVRLGKSNPPSQCCSPLERRGDQPARPLTLVIFTFFGIVKREGEFYLREVTSSQSGWSEHRSLDSRIACIAEITLLFYRTIVRSCCAGLGPPSRIKPNTPTSLITIKITPTNFTNSAKLMEIV